MDATGKTADGQSFGDIRQFKQLLLRQESRVVTGLAEKLTTYALGRRIGFSDRQDIQNIVRNVTDTGYGFRSLIHEVVQSEIFQRP